MQLRSLNEGEDHDLVTDIVRTALTAEEDGGVPLSTLAQDCSEYFEHLFQHTNNPPFLFRGRNQKLPPMGVVERKVVVGRTIKDADNSFTRTFDEYMELKFGMKDFRTNSGAFCTPDRNSAWGYGSQVSLVIPKNRSHLFVFGWRDTWSEWYILLKGAAQASAESDDRVDAVGSFLRGLAPQKVTPRDLASALTGDNEVCIYRMPVNSYYIIPLPVRFGNKAFMPGAVRVDTKSLVSALKILIKSTK